MANMCSDKFNELMMIEIKNQEMCINELIHQFLEYSSKAQDKTLSPQIKSISGQ